MPTITGEVYREAVEIEATITRLGPTFIASVSTGEGEGGGGPPSGGAGGVLSGTYPNPGFAVDMAEQSELDAHAADTTNVHGITDTAALVTTTDLSTGLAGKETAGAAATAQAFAIQRANHTGTQAVSTLTTTGAATAATFLRGEGTWSHPGTRRIIAASVLGASISGSPLWMIGATTNAAQAAGTLFGFWSDVDSEQTVELLVNVTATSLTAGQQVSLAAYAMHSNGLPTGAPIWTTPITVGTSTGVMASGSVTLPPPPFFLAFLNPSTNAGSVTITVAQPSARHLGLNFSLTNRPTLIAPSSSSFPTVTGWTVNATSAASVWGTVQNAPVIVGRA